MKKWLLLAGAIITEVMATLSLRAMVDQPEWIVLVVVGYLCAFGLLGLTLRTGVSVGVAYGIWGASGVALVALCGAVLFGEALTLGQIVGIGIVIIGVVVVELGSHDDSSELKEVIA
ncbi:multidrug efflux SMR transporter [Dietzia cinnamea]|uniref:Multidrug efflux SMR transporter n=1 Tax=Dietzia cinnamea TaxID=321318 RepID=A0ABV3YCU5_9ACTN|nr:SMR family transporter [Dietzia sp. UCD-THP]EYT62478.1 cation transporter [Dietzia sp. UCD-THP]